MNSSSCSPDMHTESDKDVLSACQRNLHSTSSTCSLLRYLQTVAYLNFDRFAAHDKLPEKLRDCHFTSLLAGDLQGLLICTVQVKCIHLAWASGNSCRPPPPATSKRHLKKTQSVSSLRGELFSRFSRKPRKQILISTCARDFTCTVR